MPLSGSCTVTPIWFLLTRTRDAIGLLEEGSIVELRVRLSIGSQHTLLHLYAYLDLRLPAYIYILWKINRKSRELIHIDVVIPLKWETTDAIECFIVLLTVSGWRARYAVVHSYLS